MPSRPAYSTRALHPSQKFDPTGHNVVPPLVENVAFAYEDLDTWRDVALKQRPGHIYSRNSNPTTHRFEAVMAELEGAGAATSFVTGMAAISTTLLALLESGKRAVTVKDAYGGSYLLFAQILPRYGVQCEIVDTDDTEVIEAAIRKGCDVLYLESPTNPTLKVLDLERLARAARAAGAVTIVDNTFATPVNQSPIDLGADLVIHSATKFLGGHGDVMGGVVCGSPELVEVIFRLREITGPGLQAQAANLLLRSLKTLALRVERHNQNALDMARFLEGQPQVRRVHYPGLESHPQHAVAKKQMRGFGGVLSFELEGGMPAVEKVLPALRYAYLAANLGQVETVAGPPAMTSHVELTRAEREEAGIPEGLIRYSIGIEDIGDLRDDMAQALKKV
jgi:cystathionine gamma-synthase